MAKTRTTVKAIEEVGIVWARSAEAAREGYVQLLCYGGGEARVYERDAYDARCDLGRDRAADGPLPYFSDIRVALRWCEEHPGGTCQVAVGGTCGLRAAGLI